MVEQAYSFQENVFTLPNPPDKDTVEGLKILCRKGMKRRGLAGKQEYEERLEHELEVILEKDLSVYFIIVWDIMNFARKNGIAVGYGRGSAAGSLVNYVLFITEVDPIEHGLLFSRFLDPARSDAADIDLDFQDSRRDEIKQYLKNKYGEDNVADIATYAYFSGKSAFKAACRVMQVPFAMANKITANIEEVDDLLAFRNFMDAYPDVYRIAKALDGRMSGTGKHASGFIVSDHPLTDLVSVESRKVAGEESRSPVVAADKNVAEQIGFVKIDLLGLKMLSVVADCVNNIRDTKKKNIDYFNLPQNDEAVFQMLSDGYTTGTFQAEQSASTKLIKDMRIDSFDDLVTSNALVRSGAWNAFGPDYLAIKAGHKKPHYPTEASKDFLEETLGKAVYQEQTMKMCTVVAGMTDAESNLVRRYTSKKKDKETLAPFKEKFISGAVANGVSEKEAKKLWENIETTAEYQFNKCLAFDTKVVVRIENETKTVELDELYKVIKEGSSEVFVLGPEYIKGINVGEPVFHRVKDIHDNGVQRVWRIWIDSKEYIDATENHRHRLSKQWKEAGRIWQNDRIWTIEGKKNVGGRRFAGEVQTYDLELESEPHAFYANGFVTHNSHAVSYSKLTYVTAWLKYYYPAEYMAALLNNEKDDNSISDYLSECKRLGIAVHTPDVNKSGLGYVVKDGSIYMGLSNIKYISDKLGARLIEMRPFTSYKDLSERVMEKGSGLTSRVLQSLNKVGAANFSDHSVDQQEAKKNYYEYLGIAILDDSAITQDMKKRLTPISETDGKDVFMITGIVQDIVSKNGWTRIDVTAGSDGKIGFFADANHGLEKGKKYVFLVAKNSLIDSVDLNDFDTSHPLMKYLRGEMSADNWTVGAKVRKTKTGKNLGTLVFTHKGVLRSCLIFDSNLSNARTHCKRGKRVRLAVNTTKDGTLFLEGAAPYEG